MPIPEHATDAELALRLATEAGAALLAVRARATSVDPVELGRLGDRAAHELLAARLAEHRPGDAVRSEEAEDDPARHTANRVWIIDPLDGTREYCERGRTDWAVHVALWSAGDSAAGRSAAGESSPGGSAAGEPGAGEPVDGELVAGAVALPALGEAYGTADPPRPPAPEPGARVRIAVSRSRPPAFLAELAERMGAELVPMGSAGAKTMAVVRGEVDAYLHGGGQYEWDSAAPVAVAVAAGLHASRLDGGPLRYNRPDPLLPDLFVCRPELVDALRAGLTEVGH
ncbi:MAG TPA: 3'(2'),5'-bisphosphate nucleotidase CysQ [Pseudonocardia sp.]|nr:3'(2'),5'-bisphosphate nucleotidase CysQ [Pseudonocardia sp.]